MLGLAFILFHFGQDISYNLPVKVLCYPKQLGPTQQVIKVVLHGVIFGQTPQIGRLHLKQVLHGRLADGNHGTAKVCDGLT